ncbi:DUF2309 domain-containing protein [Nannocystis radixulma]|uniref:Probable inorganic carbon transporter subunit DabA n=1 Tax=Nannocystis radixulma TaxID=2995305 RepID=A0ABT5B8H2_9BACT|nr:DUF2309 domain-containing protein [Nannocystis radixulma]MDC0669382.1 DUF2309 domain-containing protein [Nannocystis radixulma]
MTTPDVAPARGPRDRLRQALEHAAQWLPIQAPLEVFVHNNLLAAFQHLPFHQAMLAARRKLGVRGYFAEERYRQEHASGRIGEADLDAVFADEPLSDSPLAPHFPSERAAARIITRHSIGTETPADLHWKIVEDQATTYFAPDVGDDARNAILAGTTDWLQPQLVHLQGAEDAVARAIVGRPAFRTPVGELTALLGDRLHAAAFAERREPVAVRALWTACVEACAHYTGMPVIGARKLWTHRELLRACSDIDANDLVHPVLIPLCAAFLDRGQSQWAMPDRADGFFLAWLRIKQAGLSIRPGWMVGADKRMHEWLTRGVTAEDAALEVLAELGVGPDEVEAYVERTLLQLPGWSGMFHRLEHAPGPIGRSRAKIELLDFLAVRLTYDLYAFRDIARQLGHHGPASAIRSACARLPQIAPPAVRGPHDTAWPLFLLAQHAGVGAPTIHAASRGDIDTVIAFLDRHDDMTRMRLWHEAYERHYRVELLDAVAANVRVASMPQVAPRFQVMLCLDDRFESSRRYLEEISPEVETYGGPGFFGVAFAYQGIDDPRTFPLCPVIVTPQHRIDEVVLTQQFNLAELRKQRRQQLARASALFGRASRSLWLGLLVSIVTGMVSVVPLLLSIFAPRTAGRLRQAIRRKIVPEPKTRLTPARIGLTKAADDDLLPGFSVDEMAARVASLLENLGMTKRFGKLIVALGHDTSSVNNPLLAAYSCAACGGRSGGPNARYLAHIGNRPDVREKLAERGIVIPPDSVFVAGVYDTCAEAITWIDEDLLPASARRELADLKPILDEMCRRNAIERSRRFASAPKLRAADTALKHVEGRAVDFSEPRAELGHATCACSIVGRRELSYGLFLDRRCLLISYDPTQDPDHKILERTLAATSPVGAGIALDYYCSSVDPEKLGSGTKLPHNVTALAGVMNGSSSDLRTGLPTQATEMHEPMRLEVIVEATPEVLQDILTRQAAVAELVVNEWVRVTAIHPETREMWTFDARFGFRKYTPNPVELPLVPRSEDWCAGRRDCLKPARIVTPNNEVKHAS